MTTTPFDPGNDPVAPDPLIPVPEYADDDEPDTAAPEPDADAQLDSEPR